jgi:hypothetical protein
VDSARPTITSTPTSGEPLRGLSASSVWMDEVGPSCDHHNDILPWIMSDEFRCMREARIEEGLRSWESQPINPTSRVFIRPNHINLEDLPTYQDLTETFIERQIRLGRDRERELNLRTFYDMMRADPFAYTRNFSMPSLGSSEWEALHEGNNYIANPPQPIHSMEVVPMPEPEVPTGEGLSGIAQELASLVADTQVDIEWLQRDRRNSDLSTRNWDIVSRPGFVKDQGRQLHWGSGRVLILVRVSEVLMCDGQERYITPIQGRCYSPWILFVYRHEETWWANLNRGENKAILHIVAKMLGLSELSNLLRAAVPEAQWRLGNWPVSERESTTRLMEFCLKTISEYYQRVLVDPVEIENPSIYML